MRRYFWILLVLPLTALVAQAAEADNALWLHVRVEDTEGSKVRVNVPISMAEKVVAMVPGDHLDGGRVVLDGREFSLQELRELWTAIQASPDMTFVTVEKQTESVKVWKEKGMLRVEVRSVDADRADVRVPLEVVDALLSGEADQLDIGAAISALAKAGEGEVVAVNHADDRVRIWVDATADAE